jgi:hypothetical protein
VSTAHGLADVTEDHSLLSSSHEILKPTECVAGTSLLHSIPDTKGKTLHCVNKLPDNFESCEYLVTNDQTAAQEFILQLQQRGYEITISCDTAKLHTRYCIRFAHQRQTGRDVMLSNPELIRPAYSGHVYDIETEYGMFHAMGNLDVKNTDSIFCKFPVKNEAGERLKGKLALPGAIKAGQRASEEIKEVMPEYQCLAYEKTLFPFILFSKKRYVGNLYEDDPNAKPKQKSMGIALKRRDYAPIVKKVYGGIIDILLNKNDLLASVDFLKAQLQGLVDGKFPLEDLVISKTLKADYKDPSKIAHKVLADRIGERDEGNKPMVNDRIPFVYIHAPDAKLQGERIEHPDYIRETGVKPDYEYYITNQLLKPIAQLYALCVEDIPGYAFPPGYWMQRDIEMSDHKLYIDPVKRKDRIVALKMREVEDTLFRPYLTPKVTKRATTVKKTPEPSADPVTKLDAPVVEPKKRATRKKPIPEDGVLMISVRMDKKTVVSEIKCGKESLYKEKMTVKKADDPIVIMIRLAEVCMAYTMNEVKKDTVSIEAPNEFKHLYNQACEIYAQDVLDWNKLYEPHLRNQDVGKLREMGYLQGMHKLMNIRNKMTCTIV